MVDRQSWATPQPLFDSLARTWGPFTLDVAASSENAKCGEFFTVDDDGLSRPWCHDVGGRSVPAVVWCNPPYKDIGPWVDKALEEFDRGHMLRGVFLLPARVDRPWFQRLWRLAHVVGPHVLIDFPEERIRFVPPPGVKASNPREPSTVVVIR